MIDSEELAARIEALTETGEDVCLNLDEWREVVYSLRSVQPKLPARSEKDFS